MRSTLSILSTLIACALVGACAGTTDTGDTNEAEAPRQGSAGGEAPLDERSDGTPDESPGESSDAAGALTGFLDWEFAWSGPPLFDLGQKLRVPVPAAYERALLDGYRAAGGVLADGWRHAARQLDLMNLVGFLAQDGERAQQTRDVLALIDAYL